MNGPDPGVRYGRIDAAEPEVGDRPPHEQPGGPVYAASGRGYPNP